MNLKSLSIEGSGLSVRSKNALHRAGVHTVADMLGYTSDSLSQINNLGAKSITEILEKIEYYNQQISLNAENEKEGFRKAVCGLLAANRISIDALELLPARAYNHLLLNGYDLLEKVIFLSKDELMQIHGMDEDSADNIIRSCKRYLRANQSSISEFVAQQDDIERRKSLSSQELVADEMYRSTILTYVRANDVAVTAMGLSNRSVNQLTANGYNSMSDIIFFSQSDLMNIPKLGSGSIKEIADVISRYISTHGDRIKLYVNGDTGAALNEEAIKDTIAGIFDNIGFEGLSVNELIARLAMPVDIPQDMVKRILGKLVADGTLEYVDYRCYRVYPRFIDHIPACSAAEEREKDAVAMRLEGKTLEEIGNKYDVTRERVRQLVSKGARKIRDRYLSQTGLALFDEDYYRYLFETYNFDCKDCSQWFGVPPYVWNYFELFDIKQGKKPLEEAVRDIQTLDAGMRLRIKNYINRNRIYIDGRWVEKQRSELEPIIIKKYCTEDVSFLEFVNIFNGFLEREGIPFDKKLYYTNEVLGTRKNRLPDSRFLLWKQGEKFRYYDIDGQDYTELLEVLNLESFNDVEISAVKFVESYPDQMTKYDIRDGYELHNLLKKVIGKDEKSAYHGIVFSKMPNIRFGTPDRDRAMYEIMAENSPISLNDLCAVIHKEYGYDMKIIPNYLIPIMDYCSSGIFRKDHKKMSEENMNALSTALTDDFYFFDEVKDVYRKLFPYADIEEVNSFNLKQMGFLVNSNYVVQHFNSAEAYFADLFGREDIFDYAPLRERYSSIVLFYQVYIDLRRSLDIIEYQPDHYINFRKLKRAGISKNMLRDFCDQVYDFVEEGSFFSIQSIRRFGFESELFDEIGLDDYFFANLLLSDERFSWQKMLGTMILYKGQTDLMLKDFVSDIIRRCHKIDIYELDTLLREQYGCTSLDKYDIILKTRDSGVFYDNELQKFYSDQEEYYREIDENGGV